MEIIYAFRCQECGKRFKIGVAFGTFALCEACIRKATNKVQIQRISDEVRAEDLLGSNHL